MKVIRKCPICRFSDNGDCHRFPPQPVSVLTKDAWGHDRTDVQYLYAAAYKDGWCGEYKHDKQKFAAYVLTQP